MTDVLRRKIERSRQSQAEGAPGADRGWRLALARAARDWAGLDLEVQSLTITRASLAEVLELAPDLALICLLAGPKDALGVLMLSPSFTSALIEVQTVGRLAAQPAALRKPTRIDAAMVAGLVDRALLGLEEAMAEEADLSWTGGFSYASHVPEARPLSLMLEDEAYRVLSGEVRLGQAGRTGQAILILPATGRAESRAQRADPAETAATGFAAELSARVQAADCRLDAIIGRMTLTIRQIMALKPGEVLAMPQSALDCVSLEGVDGRPVARARLGQNRGMRALKVLVAAPAGQPSLPTAAEEVSPPALPAPEDDWRAAG